MRLMLVEKGGPRNVAVSASERHLRVFDSQKLQEIFTGFTMKEFVEYLAMLYNGTIDRTGLAGRYDFVLEYKGLVDPAAGVPTPSELRNLRIGD